MSDHFDLVVIGAGPAGEKGAAQAAYFGKRVCIIERAPRPGGAAVNTGTIPSKTLRETALYFSGIRQRGLYGIDLRVKRDISVRDFMQRERSVVETEWELIGENLNRHAIESIQGSARFHDAHTVEVERYGKPTRRITGDVILVATGSHPQPPENFEIDGTVVVDSDSLLTVQKIPRRMIVIGGGVIGCEYACTFAALGVRVTIVDAKSRLLAHLDAELSEALRQQVTARLGIVIHADTTARAVALHDGYADVTLSDGTVLSAECVLYCAGRHGTVADLGLEALGVKTNARGYLQVDEHYHTGVGNIYAAGDVIGFPALASVSMEQARVAVCHAFELKYKQRVAALLPYGVWTIPEIATVGESEDSLKRRNEPYEVGRASYRLNPRGLILGDVDGFLKILFRPDDERVLGVSIVGDSACELIHVGMTCMSFGGTLDFFIQSVFNYPSLADAYKYAAYDGLQALARRYARTSGLPTSGEHPAITDG
ncbi:MAG TPA: Si-specific NAD(P)(+) transhydrogenase [Gemmatimonadaceae bacterium]|nr:Si-specific NAD(P)(+) transhydrogenase [Gemmatimonadaceae bacterium]